MDIRLDTGITELSQRQKQEPEVKGGTGRSGNTRWIQNEYTAVTA